MTEATTDLTADQSKRVLDDVTMAVALLENITAGDEAIATAINGVLDVLRGALEVTATAS